MLSSKNLSQKSPACDAVFPLPLLLFTYGVIHIHMGTKLYPSVDLYVPSHGITYSLARTFVYPHMDLMTSTYAIADIHKVIDILPLMDIPNTFLDIAITIL